MFCCSLVSQSVEFQVSTSRLSVDFLLAASHSTPKTLLPHVQDSLYGLVIPLLPLLEVNWTAKQSNCEISGSSVSWSDPLFAMFEHVAAFSRHSLRDTGQSKFQSSLLTNVHPSTYSVGTGNLAWWLSGQGVKVTTHLHLLPRLRIHEAICLLPLYTLMTWAE